MPSYEIVHRLPTHAVRGKSGQVELSALMPCTSPVDKRGASVASMTCPLAKKKGNEGPLAERPVLNRRPGGELLPLAKVRWAFTGSHWLS